MPLMSMKTMPTLTGFRLLGWHYLRLWFFAFSCLASLYP